MVIEELRVAGYRSVQDLRLRLNPVNVLVGPNGCGKTSLYRSLYLLTRAAEGRLARTLADEGGMPSVLWAGERTKGPVRLVLGVRLEQIEYELHCGLTPTGPHDPTAFRLDPHVKEEHVWVFDGRKRVTVLERKHTFVRARDAEGRWVDLPMAVAESESVLAQLREPHRFPLLSVLRQEFLSWRFYHQFRTDPESPLRHPQTGVRTPVLSHDGRDLAAALQTIVEIGDRRALEHAVETAFPGARLQIPSPQARFRIELQTPEFPRPFDARELSDGTLHYLCLLAALLSPRPPSLLALNEPESHLHPDRLDPLARLLAQAARASQLWVTTHSETLAALIEQHGQATPVRLEKVGGATRVVEGPGGEEA